jgi:hypothetical protein
MNGTGNSFYLKQSMYNFKIFGVIKTLGFLPILVLLIFIQVACRKECSNIAVDKISCDKHYDATGSAIYYSPLWWGLFSKQENLVILDFPTYDSIFHDSQPFGDLNFDEDFLIGIFRTTNWGSDVDVKACVCENTKQNKLKLNVKYSLSNQCAGSGISEQAFIVWAVVPIKYKNYTIEYGVKDINPFPH